MSVFLQTKQKSITRKPVNGKHVLYVKVIHIYFQQKKKLYIYIQIRRRERGAGRDTVPNPVSMGQPCPFSRVSILNHNPTRIQNPLAKTSFSHSEVANTLTHSARHFHLLPKSYLRHIFHLPLHEILAVLSGRTQSAGQSFKKPQHTVLPLYHQIKYTTN